MEFPCQVARLFNIHQTGIACVNGRKLAGMYRNRGNNRGGGSSQAGVDFHHVAMVIDEMGKASSKAQGLSHVITATGKFMGTNQRLYIKVHENTAEGILKVEERNLFYRNSSGSCKEIPPLCVLDFYVHESVQRKGIGKELFVYMLKHEQVEASKLAYDRPSPKLLKFLEKHYGLAGFVSQNNNFVVFDKYFNVRTYTNSRTNSSQTTNVDSLQNSTSRSTRNSKHSQQKSEYSSQEPWPTPCSPSVKTYSGKIQSNQRGTNPIDFKPRTIGKAKDFLTNPSRLGEFTKLLNTDLDDVRKANWGTVDHRSSYEPPFKERLGQETALLKGQSPNNQKMAASHIDRIK